VSVLPDPTPDLATAVWRELYALASSLTAAGAGSDATWSAWVFKWKPQIDVVGSGAASVVVSSTRQWAGANRWNTLGFPVVSIDIYSDIRRDEKQGPYFRDAQAQALDVFHVVDPVLHRPDAGGFWWGSADGEIRIVSSSRSGGPTLDEIADSDGVWHLNANYDIQLG
jgi:hypothetical protein